MATAAASGAPEPKRPRGLKTRPDRVESVNGWFDSGGLKLARYLATPGGRATAATPALVLCHGFPVGPLDARQSAGTFPELIDRIANEMGWAAMTFTFRGCGQSEGDFSLLGWLDDLRAAVDHLVDETGVANVWLAGTSTGGSLVICEGAEDARVRGVAALAAPSRLRRLGRAASPLPRPRP